MAGYKKGDLVAAFVDGEEICSAVEKVADGKIYIKNKYYRIVAVKPENCRPAEALNIPAADMRAYVRFEKEIPYGTYSYIYYVNIDSREGFRFGFDDIITALKNIKLKKALDRDAVTYWREAVLSEYCECLESEKEPAEGLPSDFDFLIDTVDWVQSCEYDRNYEFLDELITEAEFYRENIGKNIFEREYCDRLMAGFIMQWFENDAVPDKELILFKKFTELLRERSVTEGLFVKAYSCYGGSPAFECDWNESRDCLLELMKSEDKLLEITCRGAGKASFANTLGYIYYYGRCNNGVPQYDEAFRYFSIGAAGGFYESRYKLADMFLKGVGTIKDETIARSIIESLYYELSDSGCIGLPGSKFADAALRMGSLVKSEIGHSAYFYYLQARLAINNRIRFYDCYGDRSVKQRIDEQISKCENSSDFYKVLNDKKDFSIHISPNCLYRLDYEKVHKKCSDKEQYYNIEIVPVTAEHKTKKVNIPLTVPSEGFCGYLPVIKAQVEIFSPMGDDENGSVFFNGMSCGEFTLFGEIQARGYGNFFFSVPRKNAKKFKFVSLKFKDEEDFRVFRCDDEVKLGDFIYKETLYGMEKVCVERVFEACAYEMPEPVARYEKIKVSG